MLKKLPDAGRSALLVRQLEDMAEFDLYDVLAELGYGMAPRTRTERAEAFAYKNGGWLSGLPANTAATLKALSAQFGRSGTEGLENPGVFEMPEVVRAGDLMALKGLGKPADVLRETKVRVFSAYSRAQTGKRKRPLRAPMAFAIHLRKTGLIQS